MLNEVSGDAHVSAFDCMAEDCDDAVEQANSAYPGCVIVSSLQREEASALHVIYSENESGISGGAGFWSNANGWGEIDQATKFVGVEIRNLNLPLSTGSDAKFVLQDVAVAHYAYQMRVIGAAQPV